MIINNLNEEMDELLKNLRGNILQIKEVDEILKRSLYYYMERYGCQLEKRESAEQAFILRGGKRVNKKRAVDFAY